MKKKRQNLMNPIMGGIAPVVGAGVLGSVGTATGAPSSVINSGMGGMNLLAVGNTAHIGMNLAKSLSPKRRKK